MMGGGVSTNPQQAQSDTLTMCLYQEKEKVTCPLNENTNDTWPMSLNVAITVF